MDHHVRPGGVADKRFRYVRLDIRLDLQTPLPGLEPKNANDVGHGIANIERGGVDLDLAQLDLRDVDEPIGEVEKRFCRNQDGLERVLLRGSERVTQHDLSDPDDSVEGCADVVTHVGEVLGLGSSGRFGFFFGGDQFGPCLGMDQRVTDRPFEGVGVKLVGGEMIRRTGTQRLDIQVVVNVRGEDDVRSRRPSLDRLSDQVQTARGP